MSLWRRSERRFGEWAVTLVKQRNGWRISCDVGKATEGLENELWRWWWDVKVGYLSSSAWSHTNRLKINAGSFSVLTKQTIIIARSSRWAQNFEMNNNSTCEKFLGIVSFCYLSAEHICAIGNINKDGRADGTRCPPNTRQKVTNKEGDHTEGTQIAPQWTKPCKKHLNADTTFYPTLVFSLLTQCYKGWIKSNGNSSDKTLLPLPYLSPFAKLISAVLHLRSCSVLTSL